MIDCHVHLRDWNQSEKETIFHGAELASRAGFKALFDMPNTKPPLTSRELLAKRLAYGKAKLKKLEQKIFYGVYAGVTSNLKQLREVVQFWKKNFPDCVGLKMFAGNSTGNMGLVSVAEQKSIYEELTRLNFTGVLAVHCEKETHIKKIPFNLQKPETHSIARPKIAEITSIRDQIELAKKNNFSGHLHICHISTSEGISLVNKAKQEGMKISCGVTGHHALLSTKDYSKLGFYAKMNPPLRAEEERNSVFDALLSGLVDNIESDHAPHTLEQKKTGASGVPGFAGTLRLIKSLRKAGISEMDLEKLCGKNINRIFNTNFPVTIPTNSEIDSIFQKIIAEYEFNIF